MGRCSECCPSPGRACSARRTTSRPIPPSADRDLLDAAARLERSTTRAERSSAWQTPSRAGSSRSTWAR
eukprot:8198581-Pyramimonas_sp.AAC.1